MKRISTNLLIGISVILISLGIIGFDLYLKAAGDTPAPETEQVTEAMDMDMDMDMPMDKMPMHKMPMDNSMMKNMPMHKMMAPKSEATEEEISNIEMDESAEQPELTEEELAALIDALQAEGFGDEMAAAMPEDTEEMIEEDVTESE